MFYYSSEESRQLIEKLIKEKTDITGISESKIIEEYIIGGILRDFPNHKDAETLLNMMKERYSYIDKIFLSKQEALNG